MTVKGSWVDTEERWGGGGADRQTERGGRLTDIDAGRQTLRQVAKH